RCHCKYSSPKNDAVTNSVRLDFCSSAASFSAAPPSNLPEALAVGLAAGVSEGGAYGGEPEGGGHGQGPPGAQVRPTSQPPAGAPPRRGYRTRYRQQPPVILRSVRGADPALLL